jgi:hypothetical protein
MEEDDDDDDSVIIIIVGLPRMMKGRDAYSVLVWKYEGKRTYGRPRL